MNKHHPLDEVFRNQLQDQAAAPPLHLWEQIDQKRTLKHRFFNQVRQKKPIVTLLASMAMTGVALLLWNLQQPNLQSFPIPAPQSNPPAIAQQQDAVATHEAAASEEKKPVRSSSSPSKLAAAAENATPLHRQAVLEDHTQALISAIGQHSSVVTTAFADVLTQEIAAIANTAAADREETPTVSPKRVADLPVLNRQAAPAYALDENDLSGLFGSNDPKCARFGDGNWAFYLDVMASPDLTFNTLEARSSDAVAYLEKRKETETRLFAFSGGVRLSMIADNGLALRTGVNYSQINEKFTYFNGSEEKTQIRNIFDSEGNVIGTDTITLTGERYKVSNNIYRTIDIPFIVGYEFDMGQFGMSVNGGAYLNLLFMPDGDLLDPETLEPIAIDGDNFNAFKEQVGLGYYGSLALTYQTKSGLQLLLEPHFKVFPKSVTQDQYALTQRYTSVGLFMGVRKRL
ncbi:MAG: hypothetical protein GVY26_09435 [Bacteroidetes bacterium]|jgi:hypothetical protein|nr:hypothetical protein [Bacteroidota bacterium]